jgi:hypothetical protein
MCIAVGMSSLSVALSSSLEYGCPRPLDCVKQLQRNLSSYTVALWMPLPCYLCQISGLFNINLEAVKNQWKSSWKLQNCSHSARAITICNVIPCPITLYLADKYIILFYSILNSILFKQNKKETRLKIEDYLCDSSDGPSVGSYFWPWIRIIPVLAGRFMCSNFKFLQVNLIGQ